MPKLHSIIRVVENDEVAYTYCFTLGTSPVPMVYTSGFRFRTKHAARLGFEASLTKHFGYNAS